MENVSYIMKKCCVLVSIVKKYQRLFEFIGYMGTILLFGVGEYDVLAESQNSYPCVAARSCETGECDSIIQKITVDYYDDFGCPYRLTHKVHTDEGLTNCEDAIDKHFPFKYGACEE